MTVAWHNGTWVDELPSLSLNDYGVLQAAMVVERLRSFKGRLCFLRQHVDRLLHGCEALGIDIPKQWDVSELTTELARRVYTSMLEDTGVVILATPGCIGGGPPTLILHQSRMPWQRLRHWYSSGQRLVRSEQSVAHPRCWPPTVKHRSRLNYFLADREANLQGSWAAYPGAILSDASGNLQDTSTANLIVVHQGRLICAPQKSVLHGISIQTTIQLAKAAGWSVDEQPLSAELIRSADEILLVGSIGCIWSSCQVDQQDFPGPGGTALQQLSQAWKHRVACDFIDQALAAADESTQEGR